MVTMTPPGRTPDGFAADDVFMVELEVLLHLAGVERVLLGVSLLGNGEDDEECGGEDDSADGGDGLGEEVDDGRGQQDQEDGGQADGNLGLADADVGRHLPAALAVVFPAQDEHGEAS